MNTRFLYHSNSIPILALFLTSVIWSICVSTALADSSIINTVSVSTGNAGQSHSSVTTIINGDIVENWSATSSKPISYQHKIITDSGDTYLAPVDTNTNISIAADETTRTKLIATIARLQAIISYYETLLSLQ